ncbi:WxL domain-containing protein [Enterococcus sp. AZ129]|uniref:WxL domain-containing protein n=1 Tax=unclassified Enterococcus TaxID=2608891 RepID=UPI003F1F9614
MKSIRLLGATFLASTTLLGATGAFASEPITPEPATVQTPIIAKLTVNQTPEKPVPPTEPDQGGGDQETDIEGLFGIAYAPKALSVSEELADQTSAQELDLSHDNKTAYNVGVQDKTRAKDRNWTLSAQLSWEGDTQNYMVGTTITASEGNVKLNTSGKLTEVDGQEVTIESGADNVTIGQDSSVHLMKANAGKTVNGVYNYQFKHPKLVIPNPSKVPAGNYSGNITWTLSNVMM